MRVRTILLLLVGAAAAGCGRDAPSRDQAAVASTVSSAPDTLPMPRPALGMSLAACGQEVRPDIPPEHRQPTGECELWEWSRP